MPGKEAFASVYFEIAASSDRAKRLVVISFILVDFGIAHADNNSMKSILKQLQDLCQHPEPDLQTFADASSYLHDANEIAAQYGVDPETVFEFTNPIKALAAVHRLIAASEPERFLTVPEAAKVLSVSQTKLAGWIKSNRLEAINVGLVGKRPQYRIPRDALRNLQPLNLYKPKHL